MSAPQATPCPECGDKGWLLTGGHPEGERIVPCPSCCGGSGTAASAEPQCERCDGDGWRSIEGDPHRRRCQHCNAAPAAEPDNLVAELHRLADEGCLVSADERLLRRAADRIAAADAIIKFDAEYSRDQFIEHDAIRAENERLRAERDAALTNVEALESVRDVLILNVQRIEAERDAALARANEEAALADQLDDALTRMSFMAHLLLTRTPARNYDEAVVEAETAHDAWLARRSQETP